MAKARKLQQEVDATLKRVQEGCDEWDALWDKLEDTAVRKRARHIRQKPAGSCFVTSACLRPIRPSLNGAIGQMVKRVMHCQSKSNFNCTVGMGCRQL